MWENVDVICTFKDLKELIIAELQPLIDVRAKYHVVHIASEMAPVAKV